MTAPDKSSRQEHSSNVLTKLTQLTTFTRLQFRTVSRSLFLTGNAVDAVYGVDALTLSTL